MSNKNNKFIDNMTKYNTYKNLYYRLNLKKKEVGLILKFI